MKKMLRRTKSSYHTALDRACTGLYGDLSGLTGEHSGLTGDCTGLTGDCTGLYGDLDQCQITKSQRNDHIDITKLVKVKHKENIPQINTPLKGAF